MSDPFEKAVAAIVTKVVEQCDGDMDRIRAIAQANVLAGRTLNRLMLMAASDTLILEPVALAVVISDVRKEEEAPAKGN